MNHWLQVFSLDFAIAATAALVLAIDAFVRVPGRLLGYFTTAALLGTLAASYFVDTSGVVPHGAYVTGAWVLFFKRVFLIAGALGVLGSIDWLEERTPRRQAEYYALLLFSLCGMMVLPGARDWVLLIVAFELMGIPLYILAAYAKTDGPVNERKLGPEAALKLFVTGVASSAFTLFGLALVIGVTGSTSLSAVPQGALSPLASAGMLMVLAGMGFKVGAVPFHMWVPDTYQGAPTPFVAFLSVAPKAGGMAALTVVLLSGWAQHHAVWAPALGLISASSMLVGNLFALPQTDTRRLLGFSGVAQIGYVLIALCARSEEAWRWRSSSSPPTSSPTSARSSWCTRRRRAAVATSSSSSRGSPGAHRGWARRCWCSCSRATRRARDRPDLHVRCGLACCPSGSPWPCSLPQNRALRSLPPRRPRSQRPATRPTSSIASS